MLNEVLYLGDVFFSRTRFHARTDVHSPGAHRTHGFLYVARRKTSREDNGPVPAGHEGPSHLHTDVEEVFFVIRGKLKLVLEKDGERFETILTDRDLVSVPPGVYREEINIGDEDALMCVMLGAKKPITPTYPPEHPLAKIKR